MKSKLNCLRYCIQQVVNNIVTLENLTEKGLEKELKGYRVGSNKDLAKNRIEQFSQVFIDEFSIMINELKTLNIDDNFMKDFIDENKQKLK